MKRLILLVVASSLTAHISHAATIASWTFESPNIPATVVGSTISGLAPAIGSGSASGFHADSTTTFSTAIGNGSANSLSANHWTAGDYWEFHVSTIGFIDLQLSFAQRADNTGPTNFTLAYSLDHTSFTTIGPSFFQVRADNSGGAWNSSTPNANTIKTFDVSAINALENVSDVHLRLTSFGGNPPAGTGRIDDFTITATSVPEPGCVGLMVFGAFLLSRKMDRRIRYHGIRH